MTLLERSLYRITNCTLSEICVATAIAVPSYFLARDVVAPQLKRAYRENQRSLRVRESRTVPCSEEEILRAKVLSENIHPGAPYVDSHVYHTRRTERVKSLYSSCHTAVNDNLEQGNRVFDIAIYDSDEKIVNVTRRLLLEQMALDSYDVRIEQHVCSDCDELLFGLNDEEKSAKFYFHITVV